MEEDMYGNTRSKGTIGGTSADRPMSEKAKESAAKAGETFKNSSPEEIRERMRETTGKATAAVSGSLEGYVEQSNPKVVGEAAHKVGESVREGAKAIKDEAKKGRQELKDDTGGSSVSGGSSFGQGGNL